MPLDAKGVVLGDALRFFFPLLSDEVRNQFDARCGMGVILLLLFCLQPGSYLVRYDCGVFMIKYADFYSRDVGLCLDQVEKERSLLQAKLLEFVGLLRNSNTFPPRSTLDTKNKFPGPSPDVFSLAAQNSNPPAFSSFSQLRMTPSAPVNAMAQRMKICKSQRGINLMKLSKSIKDLGPAAIQMYTRGLMARVFIGWISVMYLIRNLRMFVQRSMGILTV